MVMDPFQALERHRGLIRQIDENSTRLAQSYGVYTTTGWGEFKDANVVHFQVTFIEEPIVSHGFSINGDTLVTTRFPRAHGFVHQWKQDHRGYYTGAWLATVVDTAAFNIPQLSDDPGYSIDHTFVFTGIAIKDLPIHLLDN